MDYPKTNHYDKTFVRENMMGPNCLKLLEELMVSVTLPERARVLDLGCGTGLTSIFLAKEYGATVFANDLWVAATENYQRFKAQGLGNRIIPIHADANNLPYAGRYFDAIISVDAYHYFGRDKGFLWQKMLPLVKPKGTIAIAVPGLIEELDGAIPECMLHSWGEDDLNTMHGVDWWHRLIADEAENCHVDVREMQGFEEPWKDWLQSEQQHAIDDRPAMKAGAGEYMNFVQIVIRKGD